MQVKESMRHVPKLPEEVKVVCRSAQHLRAEKQNSRISHRDRQTDVYQQDHEALTCLCESVAWIGVARQEPHVSSLISLWLVISETLQAGYKGKPDHGRNQTTLMIDHWWVAGSDGCHFCWNIASTSAAAADEA